MRSPPRFRFVAAQAIEEVHSITVIFASTGLDVEVFVVSFGPPRDCPSGCYYQSRTGLKSGRKIGWLNTRGSYRNPEPFGRFDFNPAPGDRYVVSAAFMADLARLYSADRLQDARRRFRSEWVWALARDEDVPLATLREVARLIDARQDWLLENNPCAGADPEVRRIVNELRGVVEFAPVLPAGSYTRTITLARTATDNVTTSVRVNSGVRDRAAANARSLSGENS